jgi:hypothetical protein
MHFLPQLKVSMEKPGQFDMDAHIYWKWHKNKNSNRILNYLLREEDKVHQEAFINLINQ